MEFTTISRTRSPGKMWRVNMCWGSHSTLGSEYHANADWTGNSGWWIIETVESYNGQRSIPDQGNFIRWFSDDAFGGAGHSRTPVAAVVHGEEPMLVSIHDPILVFGLWARGKRFGITAELSRRHPNESAVGDPLIKWWLFGRYEKSLDSFSPMVGLRSCSRSRDSLCTRAFHKFWI